VRIWEGGTEASDVAGLEGRCERNGCGGGFGAWSYFSGIFLSSMRMKNKDLEGWHGGSI